MKKLHLNYQPPNFLRVAVKRSSVPHPAAIFHAHAHCNECFRESLYIPPFIAPFHIHISTILSMVLQLRTNAGLFVRLIIHMYSVCRAYLKNGQSFYNRATNTQRELFMSPNVCTPY